MQLHPGSRLTIKVNLKLNLNLETLFQFPPHPERKNVAWSFFVMSPVVHMLVNEK